MLINGLKVLIFRSILRLSSNNLQQVDVHLFHATLLTDSFLLSQFMPKCYRMNFFSPMFKPFTIITYLFDTICLKLIGNHHVGHISPVIELGSKYIPLNQAVRIRFKPQIENDTLKNKCVVAQKTRNSYSGLKSTLTNNWLEAETREFGDFQVLIDSIAPSLKVDPKVIRKKRKKIVVKPAAMETINLIIKDKLSGITSIQSYLDGN